MEISAQAEITQRKPIIDHFMISFPFLIFSSSPAEITIIKEPSTIDPTAKSQSTEAIVLVQALILDLKFHSTEKSPPEVTTSVPSIHPARAFPTSPLPS